MNKTCSNCNVSKCITLFYKNCTKCKICCKLYTERYKQQKDNKNKISEYSKKYNKEYFQREDIKAKYKPYYKKYLKSYFARRLKNDDVFKLSNNLRSRVATAIKLSGAYKSRKTTDLIGCTIAELKEHLEKQFLPGMTWENYNHKTWHIDHIKPCCMYNLQDPDQQKSCFHYSNLRPLWAVDNLSRPKSGNDI